MTISVESTGFYREGACFFPKIQSASSPLYPWSNAVLLRLSASLKDDLDWSLERRAAEKITQENKLILWDVDFHFSKLTSNDSSSFFAYARAMEECAKLCAEFSSHTLGICLYNGKADFSLLLEKRSWEETFHEWLQELSQKAMEGHELKKAGGGDEHYFSLFSTAVFAEYLNRLVSFLPDELLAFAFFDVSTFHSSAHIAQLFSKERFKHLHIGLQGARFPFKGITVCSGALSWGWCGDQDCMPRRESDASAVAIYFPSDPYCDRKVLAALDCLIEKYSSENILFRIICEEKLTEEWEGLDRIAVVPESISPQGKRKLQGFLAAGGEILSC